MTVERFSNIQSMQICLLLSILTIGSNLFFPISIIAHSELMLGSTFAFLALLALPVRYSIMVVICALASLATSPQLWTFSVMFVIEVSVIYMLTTRKIFLLMASMLYWIVLGVPVLMLVNYYYANDLPGVNAIITLHAALNGILNAAIAATLFAFIPRQWLETTISRQYKLSSNIFSISTAILVVPILLISFIFISKNANDQEIAKQDKLHSKSLLIGEITSSFLARHQLIIEQIGLAVSLSSNIEDVKKIMHAAQLNDTTFFNITTASKTGDDLYFAPHKYNALVAAMPMEARTIKNRRYFIDAKATKATALSKAIMSKGAVVAPMIAVATPIIRNKEFDGVVFGAINLLSLKQFSQEIKAIGGQRTIVITDDTGKVIYSTLSDIFLPLDQFSYNRQASIAIKKMKLLFLRQNGYLYDSTSTQYGWQVYVLEDTHEFIYSIRGQLIWLSSGLILLFGIFFWFAYKMSNLITAPLEALLHSDSKSAGNIEEDKYASVEISDMAKKLKRTSYLLQSFEDRLKLQVNEKTEKLEQLNVQLTAKAREDGLTGLLNRGGFTELANKAIKSSYRLAQPFSVVILDLDEFKKINDTYGHITGDKCLVAFAQVMQRYCKRETDIIGRYGGEEFVIFMSGKDASSHHDIIKEMHNQTRFNEIETEQEGQKMTFTVSIGICSVLSPIKLTLNELIHVADEELYKCKRAGRDRVSICTLGDNG